MDDKVTITFGGREYTGRRLTADQVSSIQGVREDTGEILDLFEIMATYSFGADMLRRHRRARAAGEETIEGFIKLMVKLMEASMDDGTEETAPAEIPATFTAHGV